jgi:hypothetical protein
VKPFITTEEAGNIAITAAEGGINYWARVPSRLKAGEQDYDYTRWDGEDGSRNDMPSDFVFFTIVDMEEERLGRFNVTVKTIKTGYRLMVKAGYNLYDRDEPDCMDAGEADMVVQFGLFGKVVYG